MNTNFLLSMRKPHLVGHTHHHYFRALLREYSQKYLEMMVMWVPTNGIHKNKSLKNIQQIYPEKSLSFSICKQPVFDTLKTWKRIMNVTTTSCVAFLSEHEWHSSDIRSQRVQCSERSLSWHCTRPNTNDCNVRLTPNRQDRMREISHTLKSSRANELPSGVTL